MIAAWRLRERGTRAEEGVSDKIAGCCRTLERTCLTYEIEDVTDGDIQMDRERMVLSRVSAVAIASHGASCSATDLRLQLKEAGVCNVNVPSISGGTLVKC